MSGRLYIFEGVDGAGKTTLSRAFAEHLRTYAGDCEWVSFPGTEPGTLGASVYELHHRFTNGPETVDRTSLQLLHVAAHIDAIERRIRPALRAGRAVVLDRFWWSTWAYGRAAGAPTRSLLAMIALEKRHWRGIKPFCIFLVDRDSLDRNPNITKLRYEYDIIAAHEGRSSHVQRISNDASVPSVVKRLDAAVARGTRVGSGPTPCQAALPLLERAPQVPGAPLIVSVGAAKTTPVFDAYWRFAAERQEVFFRRVNRSPPPWTSDPVISNFKFTNAYRASDRTSQYLIQNVVYQGDPAPREAFFRIILFKFFNRIETWELLRDELGAITARDFDVSRYDKILTAAMGRKEKLYSAAYIMPSGGPHGEPKKHRMHLHLLERMLAEHTPERLTEAPSMERAFTILRSFPTIGDFLAYQYITDLNYAEFLSFKESEFVCPGPGARDGIRKCFADLGGRSETDVIKSVADQQALEFERRGLAFRDLWGRPLQLIDCQNLFCEIDKYARVAYPEYAGASGRTRIKQRFAPRPEEVRVWYPPKWGLNHRIPAASRAGPTDAAPQASRMSDARVSRRARPRS